MKNINNSIQKNVRYKGLAIVETAIVMVLLLLLTLGIIAFGYIFLRAQHITAAARYGARLAAINGAREPDVLNNINTYLNDRNVDHSAPQITTGINPGVGQPVTVTVTGTNLDILNLGNFLTMGQGSLPITYTASVTMSKEGP